MNTTALNRRRFLQVSSSTAASLSLGFVWPNAAMAADQTEVNAWIEIHSDEHRNGPRQPHLGAHVDR